MKHDHYKSALFDNQSFRHDMNVLRSVKHKIYGQKLNELSISPYDSKRWISDNGVDTFAYGHKTLSGADEYQEETICNSARTNPCLGTGELLSPWGPSIK